MPPRGSRAPVLDAERVLEFIVVGLDRPPAPVCCRDILARPLGRVGEAREEPARPEALPLRAPVCRRTGTRRTTTSAGSPGRSRRVFAHTGSATRSSPGPKVSTPRARLLCRPRVMKSRPVRGMRQNHANPSNPAPKPRSVGTAHGPGVPAMSAASGNRLSIFQQSVFSPRVSLLHTIAIGIRRRST